MRAYGNLINRIEEHSLSTPVLGGGATIYMWSDRLPATVMDIRVSASGKTTTVTLREDRVAEWKNYYGVSFLPNENGRTWTVRNVRSGNARGTWRTAGDSGNGVTFGARAAYRDPSF